MLGGLAVVLTRSRVVGITGSLLAALGGAWFVAGAGVTTYLLKLTSINAGTPLGYSGSGAYTVHAYAEVLALFTGIGALIIFVGAVACGRVSMLSARDAADASDTTYYPDYQAASAAVPEQSSYPTVSRFPDSAPDPFPEPSTGQFPTAAGRFPPASEQYTQPSSLPPANSPFGDAPIRSPRRRRRSSCARPRARPPRPGSRAGMSAGGGGRESNPPTTRRAVHRF